MPKQKVNKYSSVTSKKGITIIELLTNKGNPLKFGYAYKFQLDMVNQRVVNLKRVKPKKNKNLITVY